jgi:hypothetical protein
MQMVQDGLNSGNLAAKGDFMRKLKASDLMRIVTLLGKIGKDLKIEEGADPMQVGMALYALFMQYADSDITGLLADIAEMDLETFNNQPFDFPLDVIQHLTESENLPHFFGRAKTLMSKLSGN